MDALTLAGTLERRGIETIPHLTTRDSNLIGLQAMLWARGQSRVRNVLAIRAIRHRWELSGNFWLTKWIHRLVKVMSRLNQEPTGRGRILAALLIYNRSSGNPLAKPGRGIRRSMKKMKAARTLHDAAHLRSRALEAF